MATITKARRLGETKLLLPLAGGAILINPALAQQATADEVLEEVVVTGLKASLKASMEMKRDAIGVVDAINAEDIGKFPDTNLGEALQRVTGMSIDRRNGEGALVTARGFGPQFNLVTLNGRQMPTADAFGGFGGAIQPHSRSFNFANLAADGISALEVYKTGRADITTGGIGATINIRTVRPFDHAGTVANVTAKALVDSGVEAGNEVTPEVSGIFSHTNDARSWGVSLNANYHRRDSSAHGATVNDWRIAQWPDTATDVGAGREVPLYVNNNSTADPGDDFVDATIRNAPAAGQQYGMPYDIRYTFADRRSERTNAQLTVQFAPTDALTLTADYTYAEHELTDDSGEQTVWMAGNGFAYLEFDVNENVATPVVLREYTGTGKDFTFTQVHREQRNDLRSAGFNAEWQASGRFHVSLDFHDSEARSQPHDPLTSGGETLFAVAGKVPSSGNCAPPDVCTNFWVQEFDFNGDLPIARRTLYPANVDAMAGVNGDSNYAFDESSIGTQILAVSYVEQQTDLQQARLDGSLDFADGRFRFGVETRDLQSRFESSVGHMLLGNWGIADAGNVPTMLDLLQPFSIVGTFDDFSAPGAATTAWKGNANALAIWAITPTAQGGGGYGDWLQGSMPDGHLTRNPRRGMDHVVEERTQAAYAQFALHRTLGSMPINLLLGARYETTDVTSTAMILVPVALVWEDTRNFRVLESDTLQPFAEENSYDEVLPSVDFDIGLTDTLKARASYSTTIARPGYYQLTAGPSVNGPSGSTLNGLQAQADAQNPRLQPLKSDNLDLSLEWYFADGAYLSATYWDKHVTQFIGNGVFDEPLYGIRDQTNGPRAHAAAEELSRRGVRTDDSALFTMIALMEHPDGFTDADGVFWPGGAAAYDDSSAQQAAFASAFDILAAPDDPEYVFAVSRPVNNRAANIHGWEFGGQYFFGGTGFGALANYTKVSGDDGYDVFADPTVNQFPLLGLSDSANVVLIYEKHNVTARLAWNWRDEFLQEANRSAQGPWKNPVYVEEYAQIDLSLWYDFNQHLSVSFEAINLTGENVRWHGRSQEQIWMLEDQGARYALGIRYRL